MAICGNWMAMGGKGSSKKLRENMKASQTAACHRKELSNIEPTSFSFSALAVKPSA
jgi:hypothetical protein